MYFELFKLIGKLNPDVIEGYQLDGNMYQILKRILTEGHIPQSVFLSDVLVPASRFKPSLTQERVLNKGGDATRITHQLFQGRVCADLEKIIQEFSPDTKQTSIEYTLSVLLPDVESLYITPNNFIVDQYDDLVNFK